MTPEPPKIVHDTRRIIAVNEAACTLFRCEPDALIDRDMMDLLVHEEWAQLARVRMQLMRQMIKMRLIKYKFRRFDGSILWATVTTEALPDGTFETTLIDEG